MKVLFLDDQVLYDDQLPAGLRQAGCEVRMLPEVLHGELGAALSEFQPDFVLTIGWSEFPRPERVSIIRAEIDYHSVPLVYWATEDPVWYDLWSRGLAQRLKPDLVATICTEYVPKYEAEGFRAVCVPFGFNPELFRPVPARPEFACDIAVVASFYDRDFDQLGRKRSLDDLVAPLLRGGYNVKIWGNNWDTARWRWIWFQDGVWQGFLPHRDGPAVYNSAKIVIGVQNEFDYATNITMRTCEVLGAGGFQLASRTKATEAMFTDRKHLVLSSSPEETLSLVDHYLDHPEERAEIAAAGRAEVNAKYTYAHRAKELLSHVRRFIRPGRRRT